jgi:hypothetical protein
VVGFALPWPPTWLSLPSGAGWPRPTPWFAWPPVALFYLEDWPTAEIARFLGCTETTVRGHLHRGRATLARRLGEAWEEEA